jgi:hypothetical protein
MVSGTLLQNGFRGRGAGAPGAARKIHRFRSVSLRWKRGLLYLLVCATVITAALAAIGLHHIYFDRTNLPDIGPFARFEFATIGHIYDANDQPLVEVARQYRRVTKYEDIPPIVRDAILAAEDKNFFSHSGVDYTIIPRVLGKVRIGALAARLAMLGGQDEVNGPAISRKEDRRSPNSLYAVIFSETSRVSKI